MRQPSPMRSRYEIPLKRARNRSRNAQKGQQYPAAPYRGSSGQIHCSIHAIWQALKIQSRPAESGGAANVVKVQCTEHPVAGLLGSLWGLACTGAKTGDACLLEWPRDWLRLQSVKRKR